MQESKENLFPNQELKSNDTLNLRDELGKYLIHWKWFVIGTILALTGLFGL